MANNLYEICKGSILTFEAKLTIPAGADLDTLKFTDTLVEGLSYEVGKATITYGDAATQIPYNTPTTAPYYTDASALISDATDADNGKFKVDLTILDPTASKTLFNPAVDTMVDIKIPVIVDTIPAAEEPADASGNKYFTNNFIVTADGADIEPDEALKIFFEEFNCEIYGGEDTVSRENDQNVILKAHIATTDSEENPNLKYNVQLTVANGLATITPNKVDTEAAVATPTVGNVYLRYGTTTGLLVPTGKYTVDVDATGKTLNFVIPHNSDMKASYLYLFAQTKTTGITPDFPDTNVIGNPLKIQLTLDGETTPICQNTGNYAIVNLIPVVVKPTVTVEKKIIL